MIVQLFLIFVVLLLLDQRPIRREHFNAKEPFLCQEIPVVLYINLEHRKDRKKEFLSNFIESEHSRLHRIDAVYEKKNGAIGCLKSHIKALERGQQLPYDNILVCEDDFEIRDHNAVPRLKEALLKLRNRDWDVLMLGQNLIASDKTDIEGVIKIKEAQTTSSYLIKKRYIPKLLKVYQECLQNYQKTGKWEGHYCTDQAWKPLQKVDNWYGLNPSVGIQRKSYSDIQEGVVSYELFRP